MACSDKKFWTMQSSTITLPYNFMELSKIFLAGFFVFSAIANLSSTTIASASMYGVRVFSGKDDLAEFKYTGYFGIDYV